MGRGKIQIKRIENLSNRQVTYSKRRNGLIKKAKEIAVLCDAKVSLMILASSGKMHEYCSTSNMVEILDNYHGQSGKKLWDAKHENLNNEIERIKTENDSMQIKLRHLKGEDLTCLNHKELMALEEALENGLTSICNKESELMDRKRKNGKMLEEENYYLKFVLRQQEIAKQQQQMATMENNVREIDNGYHHQQQQRESDYNSHMSLSAFCVQPIQPNLQERT